MQKLKSKLKSGATSIYVVVIATLLFGVITVSFIRIIINEANRTTNDELAQSAYDSALAGVEDAKVALKKYYECTQAGDSTEDAVCNNVVNQIRSALGNTNLGVQTDNDGNVTKADVNCDAVAKALQRNGDATTGGEVKIKETSSANYTTVQAYTCVSLNDTLGDYRSTLSSGSTVKVVPCRAADDFPLREIPLRVDDVECEYAPRGHVRFHGGDEALQALPVKIVYAVAGRVREIEDLLPPGGIQGHVVFHQAVAPSPGTGIIQPHVAAGEHLRGAVHPLAQRSVGVEK